MSTWASEAVACPACGAEGDVRRVRSVAADRAPAWRAAALAGQLHRPRCARCGVPIAVESPFLYTDLTRGQWLLVAPPHGWRTWPAAEAEALATFDRAAASTAAIAELVATCRVRVVFGVDELREKLAIWHGGDDD